MPDITAHIRTVVASCLIATAAVAGCGSGTTGSSHMSAVSIMGNRTVNLAVDPTAQVRNENGATIVALDRHEIRVEKDRLLLDEKEVVKFETAVVNVHLKAVGGTLTVKADGKEILNMKIP